MSAAPSAGDQQPLLGKFWGVLSDSSDEEDTGSPEERLSDRSLRYVCQTPISDERRDLIPRKTKREEKRKMQRWAALELALSPSFQVTSPVSSSPSVRPFKLPVLPPSTFSLEKVFREAEWTLVRRKKDVFRSRDSRRGVLAQEHGSASSMHRR
jgi:hypothetical protein